jgi:hypothetical protein
MRYKKTRITELSISFIIFVSKGILDKIGLKFFIHQMDFQLSPILNIL